ncbi:MAG: hypothetical protein QW299_08770 [Candidatus Caldarchaeum sp.]
MRLVRKNRVILPATVINLDDLSFVNIRGVVEACSVFPVLPNYTMADRAGAYIVCARHAGTRDRAWIGCLAKWICGVSDTVAMAGTCHEEAVLLVCRALLKSLGIEDTNADDCLDSAADDIVWAAEASVARITDKETWKEVENVGHQDTVKYIVRAITTRRPRLARIVRTEVEGLLKVAATLRTATQKHVVHRS